MSAFTFFRAAGGSDIGAKSAAKGLALFFNSFAVSDNAITIIVCAIHLCHRRTLLSVDLTNRVATPVPLAEKENF
jgi:hypothetical protein